MRSPLAVLGLGQAGGSLVASAQAGGLSVVAKAARLPRLLRSDRWLHAEILVLAVPDDAIADVAAALVAVADRKELPGLVVHMAGAQGPSALAPLLGKTAVGSFHPLASLDGKHPIPRGTLVAVDGSTRAVAARLARLARRIHCHPAQIPDEKRALYHAGAVMAGNLPVALLHHGITLLVAAGVPEDLARTSLARLLRSQADNAIAHPLARALTGPVKRGDVGTLKRHLEALAQGHVEIAAVYRELSRVLVDDVVEQPPSTRRALRHVLADGRGTTGSDPERMPPRPAARSSSHRGRARTP